MIIYTQFINHTRTFKDIKKKLISFVTFWDFFFLMLKVFTRTVKYSSRQDTRTSYYLPHTLVQVGHIGHIWVYLWCTNHPNHTYHSVHMYTYIYFSFASNFVGNTIKWQLGLLNYDASSLKSYRNNSFVFEWSVGRQEKYVDKKKLWPG